MTDWLNRLGKWRSVFAGWQLGTRTDTDPECRAVRDHREAAMLLRAEVNALTILLVQKGVFTKEEHFTQLQEEAHYLCEAYECLFPGFKATDTGMDIDPQIAVNTTRTWKLESLDESLSEEEGAVILEDYKQQLMKALESFAKGSDRTS